MLFRSTHYLLSTTHRDGQHKAAFFRGFGFTSEDWPALASALLQHARTYEVIEITPTPFGQNYVVEGPLPAPDGRAPRIDSRLNVTGGGGPSGLR